VTRLSFRSLHPAAYVVFGTAALIVLPAPARLQAQSAAQLDAARLAPFGVRVSLDSGVEEGAASSPSLAGTRFSAELTRREQTPRRTLRAWTGVTVDQWWQTQRSQSIAAGGNLDGGVTLSRRMRFEFAEHVSSAPIDLFAVRGAAALDASSAVLSGSEIPLTRTLSNDLELALTRRVGRASQLLLSGVQTLSASDLDHVTTGGGSGKFVHPFGRFTSWHVGYEAMFSASRHATVLAGARQNADFGLDYSHAVPFWAKTSVSATAGAALLSEADGRRMRMTAAATLDHRLSGRWSMKVGYDRPIEYVAGLPQPLVTDAIRTTAAALLPHQSSLTLSAGAAKGTVGVLGASRYASYVGTAHASHRLGPEWQIDLEVHDAWYRFDASPGPGLPAAFARRGFRVAMVWAPTVRG
jgi:hypothetical protein